MSSHAGIINGIILGKTGYIGGIYPFKRDIKEIDNFNSLGKYFIHSCDGITNFNGFYVENRIMDIEASSEVNLYTMIEALLNISSGGSNAFYIGEEYELLLEADSLSRMYMDQEEYLTIPENWFEASPLTPGYIEAYATFIHNKAVTFFRFPNILSLADILTIEFHIYMDSFDYNWSEDPYPIYCYGYACNTVELDSDPIALRTDEYVDLGNEFDPNTWLEIDVLDILSEINETSVEYSVLSITTTGFGTADDGPTIAKFKDYTLEPPKLVFTLDSGSLFYISFRITEIISNGNENKATLEVETRWSL